MVKSGIIKSNVMFWREFSKEKIEEFDIDIFDIENELQDKGLNVVCAFDDNFPMIDNNIKNSEKPFLFVYKGNIEGIVFWSKNPKPMLNQIEKLKDFVFYFLYTLNSYPSHIEGGLPPLEDRINTFRELSKHCPVIWRYDPILFADGIDVEWHIKNFKYLCESLKGYTNKCKISFVIESYSGCSKSIYAPSEKDKNILLANFSKIAKENGIQIEACAESGNWLKYGIVPSKCIDGEIFEHLFNEKNKNWGLTFKRKNNKIDGQRKNCGCMPAVDIGRYDTCNHKCNYCYARKSKHTSKYETPQGEIYDRKTEIEFEIF